MLAVTVVAVLATVVPLLRGGGREDDDADLTLLRDSVYGDGQGGGREHRYDGR
jgi:hypothetical protein